MRFICSTHFENKFYKEFYIILQVFTRFVKVVRPLDPLVCAVCLRRTIFVVNAVRASGLPLPSVRAMRRPSGMSNRIIIINAANPPTNLTTALLCGVSPLPRIQGWHIKTNANTQTKMEFNKFGFVRKRGGRKRNGGNGGR